MKNCTPQLHELAVLFSVRTLLWLCLVMWLKLLFPVTAMKITGWGPSRSRDTIQVPHVLGWAIPLPLLICLERKLEAGVRAGN